MITRFILGYDVVIYFIMQSFLEKKKNNNKKKKKKKKKKQQKLTSQREKLPSAILFCQQPAAIITHGKSYDLSTMSILSVVRYFLLLNQLWAGVFLLVTVMAVGLGCSNITGCIFNKT